MKVKDIISKTWRASAPTIVIRKNIHDDGILATVILKPFDSMNEAELAPYNNMTINNIEIGKNQLDLYVK